MNKKIWDLYAPFYKTAMKADSKIYEKMYVRISKVIRNKEVLEIATGPGLFAKNIAGSAKRMIATDYSEGMIAQAKKGRYPSNLIFEVADATNLPYEDDSFDVVLIANAHHIIPEPERALSEIDRVLKDKGILIAPTFVNHQGGAVSRLWSKMLKIGGVRFEHEWSKNDYEDFLKKNGWKVVNSKSLGARITMDYVECVRS